MREDGVQDLKAQLCPSEMNVRNQNDEIIKLRNRITGSYLQRELDLSKHELKSPRKQLQQEIEKNKGFEDQIVQLKNKVEELGKS